MPSRISASRIRSSVTGGRVQGLDTGDEGERDRFGHQRQGNGEAGKHLVLQALLVQGLQDHMPGAVGCVTGPPHRPFAEVAGVAAEATLVNASLGRAVERQPSVFKVIDGLDGLVGHNFGGLLVHKIVAALDRVVGVPLGFVFLRITQSGADTALRRTGMAGWFVDQMPIDARVTLYSRFGPWLDNTCAVAFVAVLLLPAVIVLIGRRSKASRVESTQSKKRPSGR